MGIALGYADKEVVMSKGRLEAFSDGVMAIIITITVLLIEPPKGADLKALAEIISLVLVYTVSFIMIGTNWANHHHLLQVTERINGKIIWANSFYLFTLSFYPVSTGWVGQTNFAEIPTAMYAAVNLVESLAFILLERTIISSHDCVKQAVGKGKKEIVTIILEVLALACAFFTPVRFMTYLLLLVMTGLWIIPDLRLNRVYQESKSMN